MSAFAYYTEPCRGWCDGQAAGSAGESSRVILQKWNDVAAVERARYQVLARVERDRAKRVGQTSDDVTDEVTEQPASSAYWALVL